MLLAAGMLAFLGAVICIIASVPLAASPARALPGGTDNASAASAAGASGPQRSLSALHGAGGSAGPSVLPGEPAASVFPPPPVPLLSRFLCTPLAAACPSGTEQGDAAGERAELLLLQSTAEQLRQTALQQEARIRADRDTIRELTGKLGRCESGLPRGLQDAGPRRDTMADGAWDSPALLLELEDAVRALRDRIERIEVSGAPSGDTGWRVPGPWSCRPVTRNMSLAGTIGASWSESRVGAWHGDLGTRMETGVHLKWELIETQVWGCLARMMLSLDVLPPKPRAAPTPYSLRLGVRLAVLLASPRVPH